MNPKIFSFRAWLNNIPIQDPIDRQMAALLQVILLGLIIIFFLATIITIFLLPSPAVPPLAYVVRFIIGSLVFGIPVFLLQRGHYRGSVFVILALLLLMMSYVVFNANLRDIAENLAFFTVAILLAGLLIGRTTLFIVFALSAILVLLSAFLEPDATIRSDDIVIAINFILLNGLMSVFIYSFGITLRKSLRSVLRREEDLKTEIVHRKQAEEEVHKLNAELERRVHERTAELESANRELESFSYSVSHDLRAPLRAINGYTHIVKSEHSESLPPEGRQYLEQIIRSNERVNQLIEGLLDFSRTARRNLQKQSVDPRSLVETVIETLAPETENRKIDWRISALPEVQADPILLRQVFANLIGNGIKYTSKQDEAQIEIGSLHQEGQDVFYIRDNGVGFDMNNADKLFGIFQRLHDDDEFEGTGIGLATVQRIILRHNGRIWAEAEPDKGATFYFTVGR
jgi:signal transduction histidine kinase